jgi:hypothetical protein
MHSLLITHSNFNWHRTALIEVSVDYFLQECAMSISRISRAGFRLVDEYDESRESLITNKNSSSVANKQAEMDRQQKNAQIKKYEKSQLSDQANKKYLVRHGWGIGTIRKYGIVNKSKISGKWKLFFYTYRTKDQVIGPAARAGRNKTTLNYHRDVYSRAIPGSEFKPKHISRPKPKFPEQLEKNLTEINKLDGSKYKEKFLKKESGDEIDYISIDDSSKDTDLLRMMSGISSALNQRLQAEVPGKNPRIPLKKPLATNYMLMLSFAVHSACKDQFNTTAREKKDAISQPTIIAALNYLKQLPLLESVIEHDDERPLGTDSMHVNLAWRIAYKMAATSTGFDMLKKINTVESEQHYTNLPALPGTASAEEKADAARQKRKNLRRDQNVRLFMQGADALLQEEKPEVLSNADPASLLVFCRDNDRWQKSQPNTLLVNALPALQTILARNEQDAAPELKTGWTNTVNASRGNIPDQPLWAANALRNGFLSNAGGSPFAKANARLEKVSLQVTRGLRNQNHEETTQQRQNLRLRDQTEAPSALPRSIKRNKGKTPFNRSIKVDIASNSVLLQREKMVVALRLMNKILGRKLPLNIMSADGVLNGNQFLAIRNNEFALKKIAEIIYVRAWAASTQSEILDGRPLSDSVAEKLHTDNFLLPLMGLDSIPANLVDCFYKIKNYVKDITKEPLTPTILNGFFNDIDPAGPFNNHPHQEAENGCPIDTIKDIPDLKNIHDMSLDQCVVAFQRARDHLVNGVDGERITQDDILSRSDIATYLNRQTQRMRLASVIKFSDGASAGVGLAGLTAIIARVSLGGAFGLRANMSYRRSRVATAEIGVNASSGYARFGTETNHTSRSGAGGSFGWSLAKFRYFSAGTGGYADGKLIYNPGKFTGVTLRLDRLGQDITGREGQIPGVAGDADLTVDLGNLVEQVIMGRKTNGSLLQELLEATPQLSVCWVDEGDSTTRDQGYIAQTGVLLGAFVNGVGIGSAASLSRTRRYQDQHYEEQTGALRSRGIVRAERTSVSAQATALGITNLTTLTGKPIVANETVAIAEVLGAEAEIYRDGTREEIRTIDYQGQIQSRTFKLIIHANAEAFASSVEPHIEEWGQRFVQVKEPSNYSYDDSDAGPQIVSQQLKATQEQAGIVRDLIQDIRETADPNTSYIEYLELEEATTIEINRCRHMAQMAGLAGAEGDKEREILEEAAERLLNDPTSYVRRFLFTSTTRVVDEGRQLNLVGSFASTTQVSETVMRDGYSG